MARALAAGLRAACLIAVALGLPTPLSAQHVQPAPVADLVHLQLAGGTVQVLDLPDAPTAAFELELVAGGEVHTLRLFPHSVRADGFRLLVQQADGSIVEAEPAPVATVRGVVEGWDGSVVAGSLIEGRLEALVRFDGHTPLLGVQPARSGRAGEHVVYTAADNVDHGGTCGTPDLPAGEGGGQGPAGAPDGSPTPDEICEIAADADVEFYEKNGSSVAATQLDIENVINGCEAIYDAEVGILYEITTILVRSAEPDPYGAFGASAMLSEFQNHWNAQHGDIDRDVAHLFTGKNITGSTIGVAHLGVICALSQAYALSQSKYTNNFTNRVGLTAHELGHNWNAQHCDGQGDCRIMCSCLGCCGPVTTFGNTAEGSISTKKAQAGCLDSTVPPALPVITQIAPQSAPALFGNSIELTGTFEDITQVSVGGTVLGQGGFSAIGTTSVHFAPPPAATLGPVAVTVTNETGTSNAVTLDYVATSPPVLYAPITLPTTDDMRWNMVAAPGQTLTLLIALSPTMFSYQGHQILAGLVILWSGPSDAAGLAALEAPIPASAAGLTIWSQVAATSPGLDGVSPAVLTFFQ